MNVDDIFFNTLVLNIASGLLAGQGQERDLRYRDIPDKKKEELLAEDAVNYADAIMRKLKQRSE